MPDQSKRLRPSQIQEDRDAFAALKTLAGYSPANSTYEMTALTAAQASLVAAQEAETQAVAAAVATRDIAVARE